MEPRARNVPSAETIPPDKWIPVLLAKTAEHEGTYDSVQRNLDGQGVSYGIIQWTQRGGGLYELLAAMQRRDPALFDRTFGGNAAAAALLAHAYARDLGPLDGAVLWDDPWLSRFRAAGREPAFQAVQRELAATSDYMRAAVDIAKILGLQSERAMVVYYNRTVHQGPAGATKCARALARFYDEHPGERPTTDVGVLAQLGWQCASGFTRPPGTPPSARWKSVPDELDILMDGRLQTVPGPFLHMFAGKWDLHALIIRRTSSILLDPSLSDLPVEFPPRLAS